MKSKVIEISSEQLERIEKLRKQKERNYGFSFNGYRQFYPKVEGNNQIKDIGYTAKIFLGSGDVIRRVYPDRKEWKSLLQIIPEAFCRILVNDHILLYSLIKNDYQYNFASYLYLCPYNAWALDRARYKPQYEIDLTKLGQCSKKGYIKISIDCIKKRREELEAFITNSNSNFKRCYSFEINYLIDSALKEDNLFVYNAKQNQECNEVISFYWKIEGFKKLCLYASEFSQHEDPIHDCTIAEYYYLTMK